MEGIKSVDQVSHPINHLGVRHRSVFNNRSMIFYSSSFRQSDDMFTYSETDEKRTISIYFTLKRLTDNKTSIVIDYYSRKDSLSQIYFSLFMKKKLSKQLAVSLENIETLSLDDTGYYPDVA